MSSLLEGLRHCTSRAICSNCNRQPPGTFARKEIRHSNPCVQVLCLSLRTAMGSLSLSVRFFSPKLLTALSSLNISKLIMVKSVNQLP